MKKLSYLLITVLALLLLASCVTKAPEKDLMSQLKESADFIKAKMNGFEPEIGIVLGSGLGELGDEIENPIIIDYKDIPNFPVSTVAGHKGQLIIGELSGKKVICMSGRFHYYEGYETYQTVFPIQVMKLLGVEKLILTNSAGCVNTEWESGTLMLITDHINLLTPSPLRGPNLDELGERFFDMTYAYDRELQQIALEQAKELGIDLKQGVYMYFPGPSYETPADIRAARTLGADAVGMSTVPEVTAASHCGLRTMGITCMTNMAAGILDQPLNHEEVLETSERVKEQFKTLIRAIVKAM